MMHRRLRLLLLAVPLGCFAPAYGATLEYGAEVGLGRSDNIAREATDTQPENMAIAGLQLHVDREGSRASGRIRGDLDFIDYLDDTYDTELTGRIDGSAALKLAGERIKWIVSDSFGQTQVDRFAAVTPENREHVNYFSTGPDLALRLGASGFADLQGRYSSVRYETTPQDSDRAYGALGIGRRLSGGAELSLNLTGEKVEFDDPLANTDYDRYSAFVRYAIKGARTELAVNAGGTRVEAIDNSNGLLAQLELSRRISPASTLSLSAGRQTTDAADSFRAMSSGATGVIDTGSAALSSDSFQRDYVGAGWRYERSRTGLEITARYSEDTFEDAPEFDLERGEYQLAISRRMTPALTGRIYGLLAQATYDNAGFDDDEAAAGATVDWRLGRMLGLQFRFEHRTRDATGAASDYDENRGFVTLTWRSR